MNEPPFDSVCDVCGEPTDLLSPGTDADGRHVLMCQDCEAESE